MGISKWKYIAMNRQLLLKYVDLLFLPPIHKLYLELFGTVCKWLLQQHAVSQVNISILLDISTDIDISLRNIKGFMIQGGDPSGTGKGNMRCLTMFVI